MTKCTPIILLTILLACLTACSAPTQATKQTQATQVREFDDTVTVSYLGPEGTYTQEACGVFFDGKGTYTPYETVNDAVSALTKGESDYAVIPQENTIGGAVTEYVDLLLKTPEVSVVGEVELPITQNLLTLPGTSLEKIKTVYSHKQGLTQGKEWLEANLPDAQVIEVSSTAEGARMVSEGKNPTAAAIASAACADVYGLEILAGGIQNNDSNVTRFYVLSKEEAATAASDRLSFIASGDAGELPALMKEMQKRKMNLVALHDRPLATELGEYFYLIECSDCDYKDYESITAKSAFDFRYLGSFAVK